ncbi:MAG: tRNA preQ1(34) S-adenosylmethionine ribosyltransferase-isomerase QueA [Campylobacterales bacterium]
MNPDLLTESYLFELPNELIATAPAQPRDHSRLMLYNRATQEVSHHRFYELPALVPAECGIILNNTKVIKARLFGIKETGGRVELLINRPIDNDLFSVFIRGKVHSGSLLLFGSLRAEVVSLEDDGSRLVRFSHDGSPLTPTQLYQLLETLGELPLPPYMHRGATPDDEIFYQPVFAKHEGSVAAPTASLHFTQELLHQLSLTHPLAYVTLHVGAGTFKPVESKIITDHQMHAELYTLSDEAKELIDTPRPLLAVGSTATRTIEHYWRTRQTYGECNLFLHPGNPPKRVNYLLTNFHLPASTLIMLVASLIGREKTLELYQLAIQERYRFYSYGDAMLIL